MENTTSELAVGRAWLCARAVERLAKEIRSCSCKSTRKRRRETGGGGRRQRWRLKGWTVTQKALEEFLKGCHCGLQADDAPSAAHSLRNLPMIRKSIGDFVPVPTALETPFSQFFGTS